MSKITLQQRGDGHTVRQVLLDERFYREDLEFLRAYLDGEYPNGWYQAWHMKDDTAGPYGSVLFCFSVTVQDAAIPIAKSVLVRFKGVNGGTGWSCTIYSDGEGGTFDLRGEFYKRSIKKT